MTMNTLKKYINPSRSEWNAITARMSVSDEEINGVVERILQRVRNDGDKALHDISIEIEGYCPDSLTVTSQEFEEAEKSISEELKNAIAEAYANILKFHAAQYFGGIDVRVTRGVRCKQRAVAIDKVGLYIPGGSAPLFSTVLMLAIPAKVAGCRKVIMCTPLDKDGKVSPVVLYVARLCGVDTVFKLGGAQAIAAMAYGTESVPKVDKIFGPGNRYVMKAKQMVNNVTAIDMPAGPSEVMVMADDSCDPRFVASDMLSQAEHGVDSQAVLVCMDEALADRVQEQIELQKASLSRRDIIDKALECSRMVVLGSRDEMIDFANCYAAEHLIISMTDPWDIADRIIAAGSVFIGNYSPESAGDYASGTNHTLPTSGWARSYSGLNLDSFMRKITYQQITSEGLAGLGNSIMAMACAEGLDAHANAVRIRLKDISNE